MDEDELKTLLEEIKSTFIVGKIMTPKKEFKYYEDYKENNNSDYDVLPKRNLKEYWYKKDGKIHRISPEEIISYHLDLLSFIDCLRDRDFYFIKIGREIEGLIHFSDLKKHRVRILFYILISALELKLRKFYKSKEEFSKKTLSETRIKEINKLIEEDKKRNQEMPFLNYLNLSDFFNIAGKDKEFLDRILHTRKKFKNEFFSLVNLRNWVAHPTREKIPINKNIKEFLIKQKKKLFHLYRLLEED